LKSLLSSSTISPATASSDGASPPGVANGAGPDVSKSPAKGNMPGVFVMMAPEEKARLAATGQAQPGAGGVPAALPPRPSVLGLLWRGIAWVVKQITARVPSAPTRGDGEPFVKMPWFLSRARFWIDREHTGRKVRGLLVGQGMGRLCVQSECSDTRAK
jgi:hypothetical protein